MRIRAGFVFGAVGLASLSVPGMQARGAFVDFNTPGSLEANFSLNHEGAGIRYAEVPTGGLNNSRAVDSLPFVIGFQPHTSAVFDQGSFRFSQAGDRVELSQFIFRQNRDSRSVFWSFANLGIVSDPNEVLSSNLAPNSFATVRVVSDPRTNNGVFLEATAKSGAGVFEDTAFAGTGDLITGHWYRFAVGLEHVSPSQILVNADLEDWGTAGVARLSTVLTLPATVISVMTGDSVLEDNSVWGGFLSHAEGGADLIDNFSVVPLPGVGALLLSGAVVVVLRKKTRQRSRTAPCVI